MIILIFQNKKLVDTIFQNLLEVTILSNHTKHTPSVRVFFEAKRRKIYREAVNKKQNLFVKQKLLDTIFCKNLLEVTLLTKKILSNK
ncbi:hypothetical protein ASG31_08880 [Chryseobacterium sp. Leaf404]|nr:hypothetical protein ASG31_08880 [Chryseobacterium sp. Leaf404]